MNYSELESAVEQWQMKLVIQYPFNDQLVDHLLICLGRDNVDMVEKNKQVWYGNPM